MAPLTPHWEQPSHPTIQKVIFSQDSNEFTSKSVSTIDVPPFGLYARLQFPPCTRADEPTYATVQMGKREHLNLNSDLVYINHSCEPSVIFDMSSHSIIAGPSGLKPGQELTFFYPSTEWAMAQGFSCFCGSPDCRGYIDGARNMQRAKLDGMWLNTHIRELLEERDSGREKDANGSTNGDRHGQGISAVDDEMEDALLQTLEQARKMLEAAQKAVDAYTARHAKNGVKGVNGSSVNGGFEKKGENGTRAGVSARELSGEIGGDTRRGVTSREMSGEMGGDTSVQV